ncbi:MULTISPECIES: hypothetical protein [Methylosinus]|nr:MULTISPECIES: hypothetical protein [Methylosinus]
MRTTIWRGRSRSSMKRVRPARGDIHGKRDITTRLLRGARL